MPWVAVCTDGLQVEPKPFHTRIGPPQRRVQPAETSGLSDTASFGLCFKGWLTKHQRGRRCLPRLRQLREPTMYRHSALSQLTSHTPFEKYNHPHSSKDKTRITQVLRDRLASECRSIPLAKARLLLSSLPWPPERPLQRPSCPSRGLCWGRL